MPPITPQINPKDLPMPLTRCLLLFGISLMLLACKPNYSGTKAAGRIETTLSSDGKLLAVLLDRREESPTLLIKWLDREEPWLKIPAPKYTNSIRFGLIGYGLLLTHAQPGPAGASQLSRWDASRPDQPSEILYQGSHVEYPVEVSPGQYLVKICKFAPRDDGCIGRGFIGHRGLDPQWRGVADGRNQPR